MKAVNSFVVWVLERINTDHLIECALLLVSSLSLSHFITVDVVFPSEKGIFDDFFCFVRKIRLIIPRHFKKCGILYYTLHSKNCVRVPVRLCVCPSVCLTICTSVRQWELILGRSVLGLQMGKFWQISPWLTLEISFHSLYLSFLYRFSSKLVWESILWRSCRWVNFDK